MSDLQLITESTISRTDNSIYAVIDIRLHHDQILEEYSSNYSSLTETVQANYNTKHSVFVLRLDGENKDNFDQVPTLKSFINNLEETTSARVLDCIICEMLPGGVTGIHEEQYSYDEGVQHFHYCLIENPNCRIDFNEFSEFEELPSWQEKQLYTIDTRKPHNTVYHDENPTDGDSRVIIILNMYDKDKILMSEEDIIATHIRQNKLISRLFYGANGVNIPWD
jgi:hypothetical protein